METLVIYKIYHLFTVLIHNYYYKINFIKYDNITFRFLFYFFEVEPDHYLDKNMETFN